LSFQRHFAIGASVWRELGFSGVLRGRYKWVGVDAAVGYSPYFLIVTDPCANVLLDGSVRVSVSALGFLVEEAEVSHGFRVGGIYDDFFGWGGMVGYQIEATLNEYFVLAAGAGLQAFPLGHEKASRHAAAQCGAAGTGGLVPLTPNLHWYLGMTLFFYPF
ncbi:MAG: hypothetical protein QF464_15850, partial [Myxococcota bacterium]|nr:hypothetical protein [Myxococcota bacterium]